MRTCPDPYLRWEIPQTDVFILILVKIRCFQPKRQKSDHFGTYTGDSQTSHLRYGSGVNNDIFPGKFSGWYRYKIPFPTVIFKNSVFFCARLRFTLRSSQNRTDRANHSPRTSRWVKPSNWALTTSPIPNLVDIDVPIPPRKLWWATEPATVGAISSPQPISVIFEEIPGKSKRLYIFLLCLLFWH